MVDFDYKHSTLSQQLLQRVRSSSYFQAEISIISPCELFIVIILQNLDKNNQKILNFILKTEAVVRSAGIEETVNILVCVWIPEKFNN